MVAIGGFTVEQVLYGKPEAVVEEVVGALGNGCNGGKKANGGREDNKGSRSEGWWNACTSAALAYGDEGFVTQEDFDPRTRSVSKLNPRPETLNPKPEILIHLVPIPET